MDPRHTMSTAETLDVSRAQSFAERVWEDEILPTLSDYIRIPNESQAFDQEWHEHGHMERAVSLIAEASSSRCNRASAGTSAG